MRTTIVVLGKVKQNKNKTNYIDTTEGRVFLGKTSGFEPGDDISGEAVCDPISINYPAVAATGTLNTPGYRPEVAAHTENAWQCQNFMSDEMLTKVIVNKSIKAKANLNLAIIDQKTKTIATVEPTTLWAMAV